MMQRRASVVALGTLVGACVEQQAHSVAVALVTFTMSMTAYALCLLDWHDPKAGNAIYLLIFLTIVTFIMVIVTIRTVYRRWRTASTEEYVSEV